MEQERKEVGMEQEERRNRTMRGKHRDEKGETLVEVVASILIMTLSVLLLFSAGMASVRINKGAKDLDKEFYSAWNAAEGQSTAALDTIVPAGSKVTVAQTSAGATPPAEVDVTFYGGEGALSYKYLPSP